MPSITPTTEPVTFDELQHVVVVLTALGKRAESNVQFVETMVLQSAAESIADALDMVRDCADD